jgi:hypothetical protein
VLPDFCGAEILEQGSEERGLGSQPREVVGEQTDAHECHGRRPDVDRLVALSDALYRQVGSRRPSPLDFRNTTIPPMHHRSVANDLRTADRHHVASLSPAERVALALQLGDESIALYAQASGQSIQAARRALEWRRQARRRPSACIEALLA